MTIGESRRLAQLFRAKLKEIRKTEPVFCILDTVNDPHEISLDENVSRSDMHPADEFEAFKKVADDHGWGAEEIAARFGVSAHVVRQRMRLGAVSPSRRVHLLVKPTRPGLTTNLVVNTDRRTYHLELRSTEATYMASVSWRYPQDELLALRGRASADAVAAPIASGIDLASLRFRYEITGDDAPWRPLRAFDDGRQVFIAFPAAIVQGEAPPLFVVGAEGGAELVNYRVRDNYYVVDRLFEAAELRLGAGKRQARVRIVRTDAERGR